MSLQRALHNFWSQFGIPAHMIGQTENDTFPNITYSFSIAPLYNSASMTAFVWLQEEENASVNEQREKLFRAICKALPEEGTMIEYQGGYALLFRNNDFLSVYNTGEIINGRKIYGGRISYTMKHYGDAV